MAERRETGSHPGAGPSLDSGAHSGAGPSLDSGAHPGPGPSPDSGSRPGPGSRPDNGDDAATRDVIVVGAGQAGLSAAFHLKRRDIDFEVLDANEGPGGAWRHRPDSLTFGGAHGLHDLPGTPLGTPDPTEPASAVVTRYYGDYEREHELPVRRPVRVLEVVSAEDAGGGLRVAAGFDRASSASNGAAPASSTATSPAPAPAVSPAAAPAFSTATSPVASPEPGGDVVPPLLVRTDAGTWRTRLLINATGTWDRPYWPFYPGRDTFEGRQVHTRDLRDESELAGMRVAVVGAGTSAVQLLLRLQDLGASTTWVTRRPPQWTDRDFDTEWGRDVERSVTERTREGLVPLSVVAATGLPLTPEYRAGIESGVLVSAGPLDRIVPDGIVLASGEHVSADVIVWATGYRASISHLAPLRLREPGGGIRTDGVHVARDPRVLLVGYGASASTVGATRAGRRAALAAARLLESASMRP